MSISPAGWYPDSQDQTQQRYWDGSRWTDHLAPMPAVASPSTQSGSATTSLVLGVLSLVCLGALAGIPAMIFGRSASREIERSGGRIGGSGLATAGFVTGLIGTVVTTIAVIFVLAVFVFGNSVEDSFTDTCRTIGSDQTTCE